MDIESQMMLAALVCESLFYEVEVLFFFFANAQIGAYDGDMAGAGNEVIIQRAKEKCGDLYIVQGLKEREGAVWELVAGGDEKYLFHKLICWIGIKLCSRGPVFDDLRQLVE